MLIYNHKKQKEDFKMKKFLLKLMLNLNNIEYVEEVNGTIYTIKKTENSFEYVKLK